MHICEIGYNIQQYYMYVLLLKNCTKVIYFANHVHVFYVLIIVARVQLEIIRDDCH